MFIAKNRSIRANEDVNVEETASDLLFEAEDVAELVAEVTGEPVEVSVDEDEVVFTVGEDEYTVTAEGDEEEVESSIKPRGRKVQAGRQVATRKTPVKANTANRKMVRRVRK